ncbi:putative quinol monooxygenase [Mycobacterium parmense]|uniref:Monooxygenase n=1 Tax=Mycobacterium parmense TaxID=185642 RepID=A0A7I7Z154_9MYCO|nr:putative quinol monooxygenase [Mycobacterium parmense]MCV7352378.1 antibiotic biosynthesis monooxygenase [Mycobacterium parmense]ORW56433.1 antibiotic biosynthesis monooxygenase [Mycobacterium parmense]BBZ47898.1 monooxygenase [Mycobacterium parmense]
MSHPVSVVARFVPLPEKRSELQALLEGMVAPTRSEAGCHSYNLYEVPADGDLVLIERYGDQAALEHHRTTDHYRDYRAQLSSLLANPVSVTVLAAVDEA